jgi:hypothetical protein
VNRGKDSSCPKDTREESGRKRAVCREPEVNRQTPSRQPPSHSTSCLVFLPPGVLLGVTKPASRITMVYLTSPRNYF